MIAGDTGMIDIEETARRLGVSIARVRELADQHQLQTYTIDGELCFRPFEVDSYAAAQRGERGAGDRERKAGA